MYLTGFSMQFSFVLILWILISNSLFAQEVEFDIPEEIDIIPGQLSVVFQEGVEKEHAIQVIEQYKYEVLNINFSPIVVSGELKSPLNSERIQKMEAHKSIISVEQLAAGNPSLNLEEETTTEHSLTSTISITFVPGLKQKQVKKLVNKYTQLVTMRIQTLPNEIVIHVGEREEEAFNRLQKNKRVRWVSYIGAPGDS